MIYQEIIQPGKCVAVLGLGITGKAAVRYCQACGARVIVSDSRPASRLQSEAGQFLGETAVEYEAGAHSVEFLAQADLVIASPGIPYDHSVIQALVAQGIPVVGELAVAASQIDVPLVAITGTNGKTTVTSLIGEIIERSGKNVFVGGNIGTPLFEYLCGKRSAEVMVLEVSSFQLQMAGEFAPDVAVLLNITPDHIDWHGGLEGYARAKMNIFRNLSADDSAILCKDDAGSMQYAADIHGEMLTFGRSEDTTARIEHLKVSVQHEGALLEFDLTGTAMGNHIGAGNAAAAILATLALGVDPEVIRNGLREFQPAPHRLQLVGDCEGVRYVDDSKATNTGAVIAALQQLEGKALLIAGGKDKGEDYRLLRESVQKKTKAVIVIGEAAGKIAAALDGCTVITPASSMDEAVTLATRLAQPGDTVLLSPACASFDMFTSYGHRGDVFAMAAKRIISDGRTAVGGGIQ
jgi:UDP-N-acetylmuramoylalanine--D-glutamate ligase